MPYCQFAAAQCLWKITWCLCLQFLVFGSSSFLHPWPALAEVIPGSLDTSFDPGTGADATIHALALQPDGSTLIGGAFTRFNGVPRNHLARLNSDGSLDPTFDPRPGIVDSFGASSLVSALLIKNNGK